MSDDKWYPARHPAIIDRELFEAVQSIVDDRGGRFWKHSIVQPFGPVARCLRGS